MPAEVAGEQFYRPSAHGAEPAMFEALQARRRTLPADDEHEREGDDVGR
jgi:hypothetical protein